jgi:GGDEF domain-containing protein
VFGSEVFRRLRRLIAGAICPELVEQRNTFERLANTDPLTGVANRRALDRALPSAEADPHVRVVLFDADNFREANKSCGHATGDQLIRMMSGAIVGAATARGFGARVFRLGGDEFAVLASEVSAYQIRDDAEAAFGTLIMGPGLRVSISGTVGRTLAEADAALQARKGTRKGSPAPERTVREVKP